MRRSGGFTLIEILVAIVLTGVVALLVYGAVAVASDTEERLQVQDRAARAGWAWRTLVEDAVRNVRPNSDYGRPTLILEQRLDGTGRPADRLVLITAGGTPPLTPDADWTVTLEQVFGWTVFTATPIGVRGANRVVLRSPDATGLDVRVFGGYPDRAWAEQWNDRRILPAAVEITYYTDAGPSNPPILLALPGGSRP